MEKNELVQISTQEDLIKIRHLTRVAAVEIGLSLVDQTKLVTAASELARNCLTYGGGGSGRIQTIRKDIRTGVKLTFEDQGPGIADMDQALQDGFTTGSGLGLGLGGSKRLVDDFEISSVVGAGTRVTVIKWK